MKVEIRVLDDPSRIWVEGTRSLYSWTAYELTVRADAFKSDRTGSCALTLERNGTEYAACSLEADYYRQDVRVGTLILGDAAHAEAWKALANDLSVAANGGSVPASEARAGQVASVDFALKCIIGANTVANATVPAVVSKRTEVS